MSSKCHFCDEKDALDRHHVVPRRFGGSDSEDNLVTVCPTCHRKLENLYDKEFYSAIGVKDSGFFEEHNNTTERCDFNDVPNHISRNVSDWPVRYDDTDHFQIYCPECGVKAVVSKLFVSENTPHIILSVFCSDCSIAGKRKIYCNPIKSGLDYTNKDEKFVEMSPRPEPDSNSTLSKTNDFSDWFVAARRLNDVRATLEDLRQDLEYPKSVISFNDLLRELGKVRSDLESRYFKEFPEKSDTSLFYGDDSNV